MNDELLERLFLPNGLWMVAKGPVSEDPEDPEEMMRNVLGYRKTEADSFVPMFTTRELAERYFSVGSGPLLRVAFSFSDVRALGPFLDGLVVIGHRQFALDPKEEYAIPFQIRDLADALHHHLLGHRHAGGQHLKPTALFQPLAPCHLG